MESNRTRGLMRQVPPTRRCCGGYTSCGDEHETSGESAYEADTDEVEQRRWVPAEIADANFNEMRRPPSVRPRAALVGPVLPYRGGIAQHTTMLHRALAKQTEVLTISFSRQYPAWLFPGASDLDADYAGYREPGVRYDIDSLNPLTWRSAVGTLRRFAPSGLVIPWWTAYWSFSFHYIAASARRARIPVTFFCHNPTEHEGTLWKRALSKWVLGTTDRFVVHAEHSKRALLEMFPQASILVHPHPVHAHLPEPSGSLARRAALELLFFGFVRPYKGLDVLIDALALLRDADVRLTIAGEFWSGLQDCRDRIASLGLGERIELRPRYHSEAEVAELFARADAVVLPYRSATGSAVIPVAYHYRKPVIATRVGGLPDVVLPERTGLLVDPGSPTALADAIRRMSAQRAAAMREDIGVLATSMTWEGLARTVLESLARPA
jgi:glycosyltransferase involved in cell wall biosynthesis